MDILSFVYLPFMFLLWGSQIFIPQLQNEGAWRPKWLIPLLGGRVCGGAEEAFGGWTGGRGPVLPRCRCVAVLGGRRVRRGWLWRAWGTRIARSRRDLRNVPLDLCLKT